MSSLLPGYGEPIATRAGVAENYGMADLCYQPRDPRKSDVQNSQNGNSNMRSDWLETSTPVEPFSGGGSDPQDQFIHKVIEDVRQMIQELSAWGSENLPTLGSIMVGGHRLLALGFVTLVVGALLVSYGN